MRVVVLSDIHGNLEALQAITEPWDELWVLGDLVNYGPNPAEVVDFVRRNATVVVRGNHDHATGAGEDPRCSEAFREIAREMQTYTESILSEGQRAYLRQLPLTVLRTVDGRRYFLCHATPSDPLFRYLPANSSQWAAEAASVQADVVLVGHTHIPFILQLGDQQIVNPGSVGQPKHGVSEVRYALVDDGQVSLKACPYRHGETIRKVQALPIDERIRQQLAHVLRQGSSTR